MRPLIYLTIAGLARCPFLLIHRLMFCFRKSSEIGRVLILGLLMCVTFCGCGDSKTPATSPAGSASGTSSGEPTTNAATATKTAKAKSEDLIKSILAMMKLESLGITAQEDELVGLLNQWQRYSQGTQAVEDEVALDETSLEAWRARLTERQLKHVRRSRFERPDIERLRNHLLMNAVVKHTAERGKNDLDRVFRVFSSLIRNTELTATHPDEVPLSPYQVYLLGKATAADRAWLFAEMLRQLKISAVILSAPLPKDAEAWDINQPFLVGVLLDKQVYLFDPRLGLPLTLPGLPIAPQNVATLEQVRSNAEILKQYSLAEDKPYAVTPELLKAPGVFVVGDPGLWCYRFSRLQRAFTGEHAMVISDPLVDLEGVEGQITRVIKWPGQAWEAAQVGIWDYPDIQLSGQESPSAQHQQTLTRITDVWKTPILGEPVKQGNETVLVARATNLFLFARLDDAQGKHEDAVKGYTRVRVQLQPVVNSLQRGERPTDFPVTERSIYACIAAYEDTLFWTGVCKFDQEDKAAHRVAVEKFEQYLKVFTKGHWGDNCHVMLAQLAAEAGDTKTAIEEIQKVSPDHPQHQGLQFLKRTWEKNTAEKPAQ